MPRTSTSATKQSRMRRSTIAPQRATEAPDRARGLAQLAARSLVEDKCTDVVVLDVRGRSQVSDYIVVASGTSDRQMRTAADSVRKIASGNGDPVVRSNLDERTTWVVLDCVDVVVHIFEPNARAHYDLEMLWGDAPRVAWEQHAPLQRERRSSTAARS